MKKKLRIISSIIFIIFCFSACYHKKGTSNFQNREQKEFSSNEQKKIDEGYILGDYHFYFMNFQKKEPVVIKDILKNFDTTILKNFETYQNKIDKSKKVNMIPFRIQYNPTNETVKTNYFLINNTNNIISLIYIEGWPQLKNIEIVEPTIISFSDEEFLKLPSKGVIAFSVTMSMPIKYENELKNNKVSDLSFDITDLKINGEKVSNTNEN